MVVVVIVNVIAICRIYWGLHPAGEILLNVVHE